MSLLPSRRADRSREPVAKLVRAFFFLRLARRAFRTYERARPGLRAARYVVPAILVAVVVQRVRARRAPQPLPTAPGPVSAADNGLPTQTATERNLEAEKG